MNKATAAHASWIVGIVTYVLPFPLGVLIFLIGLKPSDVMWIFPILPIAGFAMGIFAVSGFQDLQRRSLIAAGVGLLINGVALFAMIFALASSL